MKKKVLVTYMSLSSFVQKDLDILSSKYDVIAQKVSGNKLLLPFTLIGNFFSILSIARKSDFILVQGGGYQSFVSTVAAKIANKPSYIVAIGTDCMRLPEIGYGHFSKILLRVITSWSYKLATHIFPKHSSLVYQEYSFEKIKFPRQGIKAMLPKLKTPITPIVNGYDASFWNPEDIERTSKFLTVASHVSTRKRFLVKGLDIFLEVAKMFPKYQFTLVGSFNEKIDIPENVELLGKQSREELRRLYSSHKFYLQLSRSEGFPNSLCEAMLCGCIPIATAVGGQKEIVGNYGFLLEKNEKKYISEEFNRAIKESTKLDLEAIRGQVRNNYTLELREKLLLQNTSL